MGYKVWGLIENTFHSRLLLQGSLSTVNYKNPIVFSIFMVAENLLCIPLGGLEEIASDKKGFFEAATKFGHKVKYSEFQLKAGRVQIFRNFQVLPGLVFLLKEGFLYRMVWGAPETMAFLRENKEGFRKSIDYIESEFRLVEKLPQPGWRDHTYEGGSIDATFLVNVEISRIEENPDPDLLFINLKRALIQARKSGRESDDYGGIAVQTPIKNTNQRIYMRTDQMLFDARGYSPFMNDLEASEIEEVKIVLRGTIDSLREKFDSYRGPRIDKKLQIALEF